MLLVEAIFSEVAAKSLDLGMILGGSEAGIKLPDLPANMVVEGVKPWAATLCDLQSPHCL